MPKQFQNCMRKKFIQKLLGQVLSYQSKLIEPQGENSPVRPMILVGNEHAMTAFFTETTMKIKYAALLSVSTFAVALLLMAPTRGIAEALGGFEPKQLKIFRSPGTLSRRVSPGFTAIRRRRTWIAFLMKPKSL
jgi:hypothetical protein